MKTIKNVFNPVKQLQLILLASVLIFSAACKDDEDDDNENPNDVFKAMLVGTSEVPPNTSAATGTATLTYNKNTKVFNVVVDYSGLEATAGHIHKGSTDVAGDVVFPFSTPLISPVNYTSAPLTNAQEKDLYDHLYYVNLHSAMYPAGEIRGQLVKQ